MNKKKIAWIGISVCCILVVCAVLFFRPTHNAGDASIPTDLPKEVQSLVKDYMHASIKGTKYSAQYVHFEDDSIREAHLNAGNKLFEYDIESVEKINQNLYAFTILMKSELSVQYQYHGDDYQRVYNFVGNIDGKWCYITGISAIPADLRENLDESKYKYPEDERMLAPEDVIHE